MDARPHTAGDGDVYHRITVFHPEFRRFAESKRNPNRVVVTVEPDDVPAPRTPVSTIAGNCRRRRPVAAVPSLERAVVTAAINTDSFI
jgi:hypothetical protein